MKKIYFVIAAILLIFMVGCTNNASKKNTSTTDSVPVKVIDTFALMQKAKEDMLHLPKPYHEKEDAQAKLTELIQLAKAQNKNVFVQAGGNWCIWCLRFTDFLNKQPQLKQIIENNYLYYHLNYSKENKNDAVFEKYAPHGRDYGFPFFFIINGNGDVLDIISSETVASDNEDVYYDFTKTKQLLLKYAPKK
ncbi:thioredoxin family protein [Flavobacterium agricola]|uniref:Thioredoxin family protein n=1 Tax=Flavobacterium agricola TaxID=2870839 RepID=A0ABY6M1Z4_9FLAO|nr:thioredoxin family protein [Flavobacterium agricola]UYW02534.1 thioredoxin family protein [Flavobacterium agricola]